MINKDNAKLLKQLKSGFKRTIDWNKYQLNIKRERQNHYLDYLIDPSFPGVNILFVLSFENNVDRIAHKGHFLPKIVLKDYSVRLMDKPFFDQPVKSDMKTYGNI